MSPELQERLRWSRDEVRRRPLRTVGMALAVVGSLAPLAGWLAGLPDAVGLGVDIVRLAAACWCTGRAMR